MLTASVDRIVEIVEGQLLTGERDLMVNDVVIDSRAVSPGCAFVALPGERVDGNDFVAAALAAGARLAIVTADGAVDSAIEAAQRRRAAIVRVTDAGRALQALAAWHRSRLHCAVIGVTGSSGKTTTKDFLSSVLGGAMRVVSTEGNRNNEIGVPLTVLKAGSDTDALVVEMGMRGLGQIAELALIARPTMGLVTNVGTSHIELLGSQASIADAKGELVASVPADGAVFLNGDDDYSESLAARASARVTTYGLSDECDVRALCVELDDESRASFELSAPQGVTSIALPVPGRHNVYNALAAAAVGLRLGLSVAQVAQGLAAATFSGMRMETFTTASGIMVINDAYNANPSSMRAAVETLAALRVPGNKIAVLGDMAELGSLAELAHFGIGEQLAHLGIDTLVTVGERAKRIGDGARAEGMDPMRIRPCATADEASEVIDDIAEEGDAVLVKASRVMGLERVVEGIVASRAR